MLSRLCRAPLAVALGALAGPDFFLCTDPQAAVASAPLRRVNQDVEGQAAHGRGQSDAPSLGVLELLVRSTLTLSLFAALVTTLAVLGFSTAPAFAKLAYPSDGQLAPVSGSFGNLEPGSVAVDDSNGDTYVADSESGVVDVFETATGKELASLIGLETPAKSFGGGQVAVAANDGTGAVYVLDATDNVVDVFEANNTYHCQITGDAAPSASECNGVAGSDTPAEHFSDPGGIAVDQATGEAYVVDADNGVVDIFSLKGAYLRQISLASIPGGFSPSETRGVAVDDFNGDVYVSDSGPKVVYVFDAATGSYEATWSGSAETNPPGTPAGSFGVGKVSVAADNARGDVYVTESYPEGVTDVFEPSGGYIGQFTNTIPGVGTAVDQASGRVYVSRDPGDDENAVEIFGPAVNVPEVTTGSATEIRPSSATLDGTINADGIKLTECEFEYVEAVRYAPTSPDPYAAGQAVSCVEGLGEGSGEIGRGTQPVEVHADIAGLAVGTTYDFRLRASEEGTAVGSDEHFSTLPKPAITAAKTSNLAATSVDLEAQVNPSGIKLESCVFEYGAGVGVYSKHVDCAPPAAQIGSGTAPVSIAQHIEGLEPNVTYDWRVVASSEAGTTTSADHTFVYLEAGGGGAAGLPDHRAYEMVTPPHKNAALIGDLPEAPPPDISEQGGHLTAVVAQCFAGAPSCVPLRGVSLVGVPYTFSRTPSGWITTPLTPPASRFETDTSFGYGYNGAEEPVALFSAPTPPDGEDDFYAREPNGSSEPSFVDIGPLSPPAGGPTPYTDLYDLGSTGVRATADISRLIFGANPVWPITLGNPLAAPEEGSLLEYTHTGSTEPLLVGVSGAGAANTELIDACETRIAAASAHAGISADGRIVYFRTLNTPCTGTGPTNEAIGVPVHELFARVDGGEADAHTLAVSEPEQLSAAEPDDECTKAECAQDVAKTETQNWRAANFKGSSTDGSKAFFESEQRLTNSASEDSNNLYVYDMDAEEGHRLIDASAGEGGIPAAGGPRVQGVVGFASDGSHVYFIAKGVLRSAPSADASGRGPHGEPVSAGAVAQSGEDNLYVFDTETREIAFISTLPQSDREEWSTGAGLPANVTPDGRVLVFMSTGALTADTTRTDGADQVFRYDTLTGQLSRISIGERGFNDDGNAGVGNAQIVPGFSGYAHLGAGRSGPTMSNDGSRVFFMSPLALAAGALNDVSLGEDVYTGSPGYAENVYEWEQPGVGSCSAEEAVGCVFLLSDGRDTSIAAAELCFPSISGVCLLGADSEGKNVFFTTSDQLVRKDTDTQLDFYDARICEPERGDPCITEPPPSPEPCDQEACHDIAAAAPSLLSPGTASFNGEGNLTPIPPAVRPKALTRAQKLAIALKVCKKNKSRKKRAACAKRARAAYGPLKKHAKGKKQN
jgi:DNA-binding beta-propeller fold protein YncE